MFDSLFPKEWTTLQRLMWLKTNALARAVYETVTGNPVSFTAKAAPLRQLEVAFSPVQDLHGYDSPWPAGGGVNKLPEEWEIGGISTQNGADAPQQNTIRFKGYTPVTAGESYYLCIPSGTSAYIFWYSSSYTSAYVGNSGGYVTAGVITIPSGVSYMRLQMNQSYGTTYHNDIAINYPSSVTTYSPYSNLCPISGYEGVTVWDDPYYGGLIEWNQIAVSPFFNKSYTKNGITFDAESDGTITANGEFTGATDTNFYVGGKFGAIAGHVYLVIGTSAHFSLSTYKAVTAMDTDRKGVIATATSTGDAACYIRGDILTGGMTVSETIIPQVFDLTQMFGAGNEPATVAEFRELFPLDYYAYNAGTETTVGAVNGNSGTTVSVTFPDSVGTVYSGTLDVVSGVLTVDWAETDMGSLSWTLASSYGVHIFQASISGKAFGVSNLLSDIYDVDAVAISSIKNGGMRGHASNTNVYVRNDDYSDAQTVTTAMNGHQLVYELAEPLTYQLTPQEVQSLLGENNVWSDSNGGVTVTYRSN